MICKKCNIDKPRKSFFTGEKTCIYCRNNMRENNKKGLYNKCEDRIALENFIKNSTGYLTSTQIRKKTGIGNNVYSLLSNMVKHGHIFREKNKQLQYIYKKIERCDYLIPKKEENLKKIKKCIENIDDSYNNDLEIERIINRWIESGMSEKEIILKLKDYRY